MWRDAQGTTAGGGQGHIDVGIIIVGGVGRWRLLSPVDGGFL